MEERVHGLLQSAIGEGTASALLSEKQAGFIVLLLHRLQDALWLLHITGRIPTPEEHEKTTGNTALNPINNTIKPPAMPNFFFTISNEKFLRIDLDQLVCGISMNDHAQLHTNTDLSESTLTLQQMKELLKEDRFIWINDRIALSLRYTAPHR